MNGFNVNVAGKMVDWEVTLAYMDPDLREEIHSQYIANDWYNATPKSELLKYAKSRGLTINSDEKTLVENWNEIVEAQKFCDIYAESHAKKFDGEEFAVN